MPPKKKLNPGVSNLRIGKDLPDTTSPTLGRKIPPRNTATTAETTTTLRSEPTVETMQTISDKELQKHAMFLNDHITKQCDRQQALNVIIGLNKTIADVQNYINELGELQQFAIDDLKVYVGVVIGNFKQESRKFQLCNMIIKGKKNVLDVEVYTNKYSEELRNIKPAPQLKCTL